MKKNNKSSLIFVFSFMAIVGVMFVGNARKERAVLLNVPNNAGMGFMETAGDALIAVFQNGQVCCWDWDNLPEKQADFSVQTDRVAVLDQDRLIAISKTGKKVLSVVDLASGEKSKDISVGWADQEVWPRVSFRKDVIALIRKNPVSSAGMVLYEFLTFDLEKELFGIPVSLEINDVDDRLVDYQVDSKGILYIVGSQDKAGRMLAVDLGKGVVLWDRVDEKMEEYSSLAISPDGQIAYVGSRDGFLYKIETSTGDVLKKIPLLEKGETRSVTNDFSVLNPAFSSDGQFFVVAIIPRVYLFKADSDTLIHRCSPADRLVSKVVFSPDNDRFASSDIRASYPVKVWEMPEEK